jgi:hypothetical protein
LHCCNNNWYTIKHLAEDLISLRLIVLNKRSLERRQPDAD